VREYPKVHGELETLAKIKEGFSISRVGDGEVGVMCGSSYARERANPILAKELRTVLTRPNPKCLVGIPTMDPKGSKYRTVNEEGKIVGWARHKDRYAQLLSPDIEYYSAFISRPDCGEWMMNADYARAVQSVWLDKKVAVIGSCEGGAINKMLKAVSLTQEAVFIECPFRGAYAAIKELEKAALLSGCDMIVISAGVTATCLANRLSTRVQALDMGSIGGFLLNQLAGENNDKERNK
jgi:hypothetical protein